MIREIREMVRRTGVGMTKQGIMLIIWIAAGACADITDKAKVAQVAAGELTEARASWWGFDPENSTRFLQAAIDSRVPRLIVDKMGGAWITDPLLCVSDQEIFFEPGVEVLAKSGGFTGRNDSLFSLVCVTNVTLRGPGATLRMRRADYDAPPYVKAEWRHVLGVYGCAKINIVGLTLAESGGDGIYLGMAKGRFSNVDIHIKDVICDKNYRQGISVISAENLLIEDTIMRDTAGTGPAAGIDFEPNHADQRLKNCVMRNCLTENNQGDGYVFYLPNLTRDSEPVSIRIENCRSTGDGIGMNLTTGNLEADAVRGSLILTGCSFESSRAQGILVRSKPAHGMELIFDKCIVKNCATNNSMAPDVLLSNTVKDEYSVGGIRLERLRVQRQEERPWIGWRDHSFSFKPVTDITGSVLLETGNQQEELTLDADWAAQTFPARFSTQVPRVQANLATAKVIDTVAGLSALSKVNIRRHGTYVFFAKAGQEVVMTGQPKPVGKNPILANPLVVRSSSGDVVAQATPTNFNHVVELRFKAQDEGFYTLEFNMGGHAFTLLSANVPVAVDATSGPISLISSTGTLFVSVPHGTDLFAIGVTGEGGEAVNVSIMNPDGNEVWKKDSVVNMERYTAQDGQGQAGGLWQIRFAPPSVGFFEDFYVEALGVPGYLFLNPERYWSF